MKENRRLFLRLTALLVAIIILVLDIIFLVSKDKTSSEVENRTLQTMPTLSWSRVVSGDYTEDFESYVEDQFPFRTGWIKLKTAVDRLMGKRESNGIFLASDGYLIQNFTDPDEEDYQATLSALTAFSAAHTDLNHYLLVAPTALTVLEDKLPGGAVTGDEAGYLDRLAQDVARTGITMVDVREALTTAAETQQVYYRTDHHWTTDGAYAAYLVLAETAGLSGADTEYQRLLMSDSFSGTLTASSGFRMSETDEIYVYLPVEETVDYLVYYPNEDVTSASFYWTEDLEQRNQYTLFFHENHGEVDIETNAETGRVLLVLKDSYANCFVPFLAQDFDKIIMIDPRYYTGSLEQVLNLEGVTDVLYLYNADSLASDHYLQETLG